MILILSFRSVYETINNRPWLDSPTMRTGARQWNASDRRNQRRKDPRKRSRPRRISHRVLCIEFGFLIVPFKDHVLFCSQEPTGGVFRKRTVRITHRRRSIAASAGLVEHQLAVLDLELVDGSLGVGVILTRSILSPAINYCRHYFAVHFLAFSIEGVIAALSKMFCGQSVWRSTVDKLSESDPSNVHTGRSPSSSTRK